MPWWSAEFIEAGRWRAARNAALKELRDGDELAAYNLALAEDALRKPRRARWAYRLAASFNDPKGLHDYAVCLEEAGDVREALQVLDVLARYHPDQAAEAEALAAFMRWEYLAEGNEAALKAATRTLTWVVCEYAEWLVAQGRVAEAISALRAASEAGERDALLQLGNLLTGAEETELGMAAYAEGYARGDAFSAFNAGITLAKLGDLRGARVWIKKAAAGGDRKAVRWLREDGRRLRAARRRGPRPARAS